MERKHSLRQRRVTFGPTNAGISQAELAQRARISFNRYWRIEKGYAEPTAEEREALARELEVSVDVLFPAAQEQVA